LYAIPKVRGAIVRVQSALVKAIYGRHFGPGLLVYGLPIITLARGSRASFGASLVLVSDSHFSEPGVSHPVILRTLTATATLSVGDSVGMSGCTVCAAQLVSIGDECLLGADVLITDTDFHPVEPDGRRWRRDGVKSAPVAIGNNVFIGARSMILKGVTIGDNAIVGAGSVVVDDVPNGAIVAGVPASIVGWA
jgi:acetyltransferase-like isoleucine patch superfamily enzyme